MVEGPDSGDLTAQAKIRNAAVEHFSSEGFSRASIRAIATSAGVSAALVLHHFGSKEELRAACDEHVLRTVLERARRDSSPSGMQGLVRDYLASPNEYMLEVRYMARAIADDSPSADRFAEAIVDESELVLRAGMADGSMREFSDTRALALLTAVMSLAMLTMPPSLVRALGYEGFGPEVMMRLALPSLELYTRGLYTDERFLTAARASLADFQHVDSDDSGPHDDEPPGDPHHERTTHDD